MMRHFCSAVALLSLGCGASVNLGEPLPVDGDGGGADPPVVEAPEPGRWMGPEISLDAPVPTMAEEIFAYDVALAFDGEVFLAVWLEGDHRQAQVRAARMTPDGDVLDPISILLSGGAVRCRTCRNAPELAVAGHHGQFFVAWSVRDDSSHGYDSDVRFGRVRGSDGARLDPIGGRNVGLQRPDRHETRPTVTVADLGGEMFWAVAFEERDPASGGSRVRADLLRVRAPLVHDPGLPYALGEHAFRPAIAAAADALVLAWGEGVEGACNRLRVVRLSFSGTPGLAGPVHDHEPIATTVRDFPSATSCDAPVLAHVPSGFMVAWREAATVRGAWFDTGADAPRTAEPIVLLDQIHHQSRPRIAVGAELVVAAEAGGLPRGEEAVRIRRFTTEGEALGEASTIASARRPALAADDAGFLAVWNDRRHGMNGARLDLGADALRPTAATWGRPLNEERSPASAFDGHTILTAWLDTRDGPEPTSASAPTAVYAARMAPDQTVLDLEAFRLASHSDGVHDVVVAAAEEGGFVAVWATRASLAHAASEIVAVRITEDGEVGRSRRIARIADLPGMRRLGIAAARNGYLVVWERGTETLSGFERSVHGVLLDEALRAGEVFEVSDGEERAGWPAVATDGGRHLVVYASCSDPDTVCFNPLTPECGSDIRGLFLDESGASERVDIAEGAHCELEPVVASHAGSFFVVWEDARDFSETFTDLYGTRIAPGHLLPEDAEPVVSVPSVDGNARLVSDDLGYALVWSNYGDLRVTRIDPFGANPDGAGLLVTSDIVDVGAVPTDSYRIGTQASARFALTALGRGELFVGYDRFDYLLGHQRVKAKLLTYVPGSDPM